MKKFLKASILGLALSLTTMAASSFAAPVKDIKVPAEVQNALLQQGQAELNDFSSRDQYPENNKIIVPSSSGELGTEAIFIGLNDSDSIQSVNVPKAWNVMSAQTYSSGFWNNLAFYTWKGYGYSGYQGTTKPEKAKATASVRASGAIPSISVGGVSFMPLTTTKQVGTDESNTQHPYYAQANFSNVKVTIPTTLTIVFNNDAYISVPGIGNDSWSEDLWFWA